MSVPATAGAQAPADTPLQTGYLVHFELRSGSVRVTSIAKIENYTARRSVPAQGDWTAALLGDGGMVAWSTHVRHPLAFAPWPLAGGGIPFSVKIPHLGNVTELILQDETGTVRLQVPIDEAFYEQASAERRRFLEASRSNLHRLRSLDQKRSRDRSQLRSLEKGPERYENLPEELRALTSSRLAEDLERLSAYGPKLMNLASRDRSFIPQAGAQLTAKYRPPDPSASDRRLKAGAFTLSGTITDATTGLPVGNALLYFYQYDADGNYLGYIGSMTTSANGAYSTPVDAGRAGVWLYEVGGSTYFRQYFIREITGPTVFDITALPGVTLSGRVTDRNGTPISEVDVRVYDKTWSGYATTGADGDYNFVVPKSRPFTLSVSAPVPYISPPIEDGVVLESDTVRNFTLAAGKVVRGVVRSSQGTPLDGAGVVLRHLAETSLGLGFFDLTDADGAFTFSVPPDLRPQDFVLAAAKDGYVRHSRGLTVTGDLEVSVVLDQGVPVSGTVRDSSGEPVSPASVRAYREAEFLTSARTASDGSYAMSLTPGAYRFEVIPWTYSLMPESTPFVPLVADRVVSGPSTQDFTVAAAAGKIDFAFTFPDFHVAELVGASGRFEVKRNGATIAASYGGSWDYDPMRDKYILDYAVYLEPGTYDVAVQLLGYSPIIFNDVSAASTPITYDLPQPFRWTGVLRDSTGTPLVDQLVISYDDLLRNQSFNSTDAQGKFDIALTPGGFLKFFSPEQSGDILHVERLGAVTGDRNSDLYLEAFPSLPDSGEVVTQIYGDPNSENRYTIAIIGDGYTDISESFTDVNGNGVWDGVLYQDLNGNGLWDSYSEPTTVYGDAGYPELGTDPTVANEPFTDLNGDGYLNLDDQGVFDEKSIAVTRSFLGQDFWNMNRDLFNVFRIRIVSEQAGHDISDSNDQLVLERSTAFDTNLVNPSRGFIFSGDYSLVEQFVNEYVPAAETTILLVNQPVIFGRANSFIHMSGGPQTPLANGGVIAHEMGHNIGHLADEYTEFQATYEGGESSAGSNVTTLSNPGKIPWHELIAGATEVPSPPFSSGVGLFEGAQYYTGGIYRPTDYCMMVSADRYCPVCTRQLELRIAAIRQFLDNAIPLSPLGGIEDLRPRFAWTASRGASHYQIQVESVDSGLTVVDLDVYAISVEPAADLEAGGSYRWRIRSGVDAVWAAWSTWFNFSISADLIFSDDFESGDLSRW